MTASHASQAKPLPAKLYRYQAVTARTLAALKTRTLWFSAPAAFNDPFDCALQVVHAMDRGEMKELLELYRSQGTEFTHEFIDEYAPGGVPSDAMLDSQLTAAREAVKAHNQANRNERGIACFSATNSDMLMWSHYADGHRGMCLEFSTDRIPFSEAREVRYQRAVPRLGVMDLLTDRKSPDAIRDTLMLTKSDCWMYEQEWRLLHEKFSVAYNYDFRGLTGVFLGAAMPLDFKDMIGQLMHNSPTRLHEMERLDLEFNVRPKQVE